VVAIGGFSIVTGTFSKSNIIITAILTNRYDIAKSTIGEVTEFMTATIAPF
jgi:hypothetical protein